MTTACNQLSARASALEASRPASEAQNLIYVPEASVPLTDERVAAQVVRLCNALEDADDGVPVVHADFDLSEELLTTLAA